MEKDRSIRILDTLTANRIAAGEVAERPASVVKELVENAIDAGATRIQVTIPDSSAERITVTDNGIGMGPEDLRMCVLPHATSKIRSSEDLDAISTLGFRGEALPSIASVSRMVITSRRADDEVGYRLRIEDGKAGIPEEVACRPGTTVEVNSLFHNTPARRKFLKSPRTEMGRISDVVEHLALSRPDIAFTFRVGNHRSLVTGGKGDVLRTVQDIVGADLARQLLSVELTELGDGMAVQGLISHPSGTRSVRNYCCFINGRSVSCREVIQAVDEAYHSMLPKGRHPLVYLFLTLPPERVDVNVHPGKLEVKLRDSHQVQEGVKRAVSMALSRCQRAMTMPAPVAGQTQVVRAIRTEQPTAHYQQSVLPLTVGEPKRMSGTELYKALYRGMQKAEPPVRQDAEAASSTEAAVSAEKPRITRMEDTIMPRFSRRPAVSQTAVYAGEQKKALLQNEISKEEQTEISPETEADTALPQPVTGRLVYGTLDVIGQYRGSYILAGGEEGLYLIDQHAAAERILYERILKQAEDTPGESAQLAVPITVQLSFSQHLAVSEHILELRDFGFIVEYFGNTAYVIRGVPLWYEETQGEELFLAILEELRAGRDPVKLRSSELFRMACKRAVKANRYLSSQDISGLLSQLDACENPYTCPHGRPVAILLTEAEIRKRFLRSSIG